MVEPRFSAQAIRDLDEIWFYIAQDDPVAADRTLERLLATAHRLARMPGMGRARPELRSTYRSFPVGSFVIFYRPVSDTIEVLRCAHGAREVEAFLTLW
jgi:toxin ParE1/3/4